MLIFPEMEAKKLEAEIENWAARLGFTMENGSAPPPHYFSVFTATPHRRQLWKAIIGAVQDKRKIELMRKQLFVFNVKQKMKIKSSNQSKSFPSKLQLYSEKKTLESQIEDQKKENEKLEKCILSKASDLLFNACKLAEIESEINECKDKLLALRLLNSQQRRHINDVNPYFMNSVGNNHNDAIKPEELFSKIEIEPENWKSCIENMPHNCSLQNTIKELRHSGMSMNFLWEKAVEDKACSLRRLSSFLEDFCTVQENQLQEENNKIEKEFASKIDKLKQEICLKCLQVMVNDSETGLTNTKIRKLLEKTEVLFSTTKDGNLSEDSSYLLQEETGRAFSTNSESLMEIKNQLTCLRLKCYQEFLGSQLLKLDNEIARIRQKELAEDRNGKDELEKSSSAIVFLRQEIDKSFSVQECQTEEILRLMKKTNETSEKIEEESKDEDFQKTVKKTVEKLTVNFRDQLILFRETPLKALKGVGETSEKETPFSESIFLRLNRDAGEWKRIFQTLLINPFRSVESISKELEKRNFEVNQLEKFLDMKKESSESLREILRALNSIEYDEETREKNHLNYEKTLSNVMMKVKTLLAEKEFVEKILRNWADQPYRKMIDGTETVNGKTLKEYEELFGENKSFGK